ncbi:unnamed protein product [Schistosoma turkestanicum]|nr:unnamed protein product [Schistosoma turkestanicum]
MDTECFSSPVTSANFQKDAEETAETLSSIQTKTGFYTMAGILEFLHLEWSRMQLERTQWDVERAELHARIAFLQGKFRGLECLRNDLVRRIKMLEYALIRERSSKAQDGNSKEIEENMISVHFSRSDSGADHPKTNLDSEWQNENVQLSKYSVDLNSSEISLTFGNASLRDSSGVSLLVGDGHSSETRVLQESLKYDDFGSKGLHNSLELAMEHCGLEQNKQSQDDTFDFNVSNSSSFDCLSLTEEGGSTIESQCITDPETAEALLEFEQLVAQTSYLDKSPSIDHTNLIKHNESALHKDWDNLNEQELLQRFKEQYRANRSHAISSNLSPPDFPFISNVKLKESLNIDDKKLKITSLSSDLHMKQSNRINSNNNNNNNDQLTNFDAVEDELDNLLPNFDILINQKHQHHQQQNTLPNEILHNSNNPNQLNSTSESTLRLEDLANLSTTMSSSEFDSKQAHAVAVAMDNLDGMSECLINRSSNEKINQSTPTSLTQKPTTWTAKYTLRSHFDAIRDICFHPSESVLVTCSEDHTLKLWNLNKTIQTKKSSMFDVEPIYTFRGHNSPVLSVTMVPSLFKMDNSGHSGLMISPIYIYSGDLSGCIRSWCVSSLQLDPYDTFDTSMIGPTFEGHTDAVWSLCSRYDGLLLSTSADGTSRLWHLRPNSFVNSDVYYISNMINKCENISQQQDAVPTSATFLCTNLAHFAAGFNSGHVCLFNLETHQIVRNFQSINKTDVNDTSQNGNAYSVNSVISHPHFSLIISAHDDRQIRFWDSLSGKCVHSLTAHLDSVTTLSLDSKGTSLLSASHDCSIRIWDINTKLCIQEITGHRKKFGEAINAVAFHPTQHFMASAGSDALAKVYV